MHVLTVTHTQERDHWNTTALTHSYKDVSSDEESAPGPPQSFDLEEVHVQEYELPATPPQLPTLDDLETGI